MTWPEPRPPLSLPPVVALPGTATPWTGRLHPSLPAETVWLLHADSLTAARHTAAFELTLDLRWTRSGCTRLFELTLHTHGKDGARLGTFGHLLHPLDRASLRPLARLCRQSTWHLLVVEDGQPHAAVEMANTLDLPGLLREAWHAGPAH